MVKRMGCVYCAGKLTSGARKEGRPKKCEIKEVTLAPHLTSHSSHFTHHTSHITPHTLFLTSQRPFCPQTRQHDNTHAHHLLLFVRCSLRYAQTRTPTCILLFQPAFFSLHTPTTSISHSFAPWLRVLVLSPCSEISLRFNISANYPRGEVLVMKVLRPTLNLK